MPIVIDVIPVDASVSSGVTAAGGARTPTCRMCDSVDKFKYTSGSACSQQHAFEKSSELVLIPYVKDSGNQKVVISNQKLIYSDK